MTNEQQVRLKNVWAKVAHDAHLRGEEQARELIATLRPLLTSAYNAGVADGVQFPDANDPAVRNEFQQLSVQEILDSLSIGVVE